MLRATNSPNDLALEACACGVFADTRSDKVLTIDAAQKLRKAGDDYDLE
jgi:hypothetical protein